MEQQESSLLQKHNRMLTKNTPTPTHTPPLYFQAFCSSTQDSLESTGIINIISKNGILLDHLLFVKCLSCFLFWFIFCADKPCGACRFTGSRNVSGERSRQQEHKAGKPHQCQHCPKKFSLKHQLDTHHRVHTGEHICC